MSGTRRSHGDRIERAPTRSYRLVSAVGTSTVAIMTRRSLSPYFVSLLVVLQLLLTPFTHAATGPSGDEDCAGMTPGSGMSMDAVDCAHMTADTNGGCLQDGQTCRSHAACSCLCVYTPALGTVRVLLLEPTPPYPVEVVPVMPALDTPPFKLLRPPK